MIIIKQNFMVNITFFRLNPPDLSDTAKLPLVIREKDVVYQVSFRFCIPFG